MKTGAPGKSNQYESEIERLRTLEDIVREHIGDDELGFHLQQWLSRNWQPGSSG
jgi:hypothetical protein